MMVDLDKPFNDLLPAAAEQQRKTSLSSPCERMLPVLGPARQPPTGK
jgi:hypothetical protein